MTTVLRTSAALETFGTSTVRSRLRRGLWQRPERGVVVTHNGPLSHDESIAIALAVAAPRSAIGGLTALALDGLESPVAAGPTDIVLPEGARRPRLDGVRFHFSTELGDLDVHPLRTPRRTRAARATIDAASWTSTDIAARSIVLAAFQQRLVSVRTIREALQRRGACKRRALVVESMLDASGGIQSIPERDFGRIVAGAGLPQPTRQRVVRGKDRRHHLDADWEPWRVTVEVHGIPHLQVDRWDADIVRANEIVIGGRRLLAFTSYAIRHDPGGVRDQLLRMFRAAGWREGDAVRPPGGLTASSFVQPPARADAG